MPEKCPKCGADMEHPGGAFTSRHYACGSNISGGIGFIQSPECRIRELEEQLKAFDKANATLRLLSRQHLARAEKAESALARCQAKLKSIKQPLSTALRLLREEKNA